MKVLHVIPSVGPLRGGPSFAVRAMTRGLAERGIETHVVTTNDNGPDLLDVKLDEPIVEHGVTFRYFARQTRFYTVSLPLARWVWRHASSYDLIHVHSLFSFCSSLSAWIACTKKIPYIVRPLGVLNQWGVRNRRRILKKISLGIVEKRLLGCAVRVHYTAEQECIEAAQLGLKHRPIVIPNPVDFGSVSREEFLGQFRAQHPRLKDRRIILFLSRIDRKKGLDVLINAFHRVRAMYPAAALVIAGDGDSKLMAELRRSVREQHLDESVFWVGFLNSSAKWAALADADIFVLPSHSENFGIAVVEAMGIGVPVVVSDHVGIHREIADGEAGLVTPISEEALSVALSSLLERDTLRSKLGRNGQNLARARFTQRAVISHLIDAYTIATGIPATVR